MEALKVVRDGHVLRVTLAKPERRKAVGGMLLSLALTSALTGVTAPCWPSQTSRAVTASTGMRRPPIPSSRSSVSSLARMSDDKVLRGLLIDWGGVLTSGLDVALAAPASR